MNEALHELRGLWARHFEGKLSPAESARLDALMQDAELMEAFSQEQAGLAKAEPMESLGEKEWSALDARMLRGFRRRKLALLWKPLALLAAAGLAAAAAWPRLNDSEASARPPLGVPAETFKVAKPEEAPRRAQAVAAPRESYHEVKARRFSVVLDQDQAGPASVRIFGASGALVAQLYSGKLEAGKHRFEWNGQEAQGRAAAPGNYEIEIKGSSGTERRDFELRPAR